MSKLDKLSRSVRRVFVIHMALIVNAILIIFTIMNVAKQDYNTAYIVICVFGIVNTSLLLEWYMGIGLRAGMVFKDGGILCKVTKDEEHKKVLRYRNLFLVRYDYHKRSGSVIYSTFHKRESILNPESSFGYMVYNVHTKKLVTTKNKILDRVS